MIGDGVITVFVFFSCWYMLKVSEPSLLLLIFLLKFLFHGINQLVLMKLYYVV